MRTLIALSIALISPAALSDEGVHVAVVGGAGLAQGLLGGHLELRKDHLAIFAGSGWIYSVLLDTGLLGNIYDDSGYGAVAGVRWFAGASGDRLFLSSQFGFSVQRNPGDPPEHFPPTWHHSNATTVTAGWRFKWSHFLADAGAGGGLLFKSDDGYQAHFVPDITLALGFEL
jgi:hypothetical protein